MQRYADGVLIAAAVLVFIAHHEWVSASQCSRDHWMPVEECRHLYRKMRIPVLRSACPGCRIRRKAKACVIGARHLADQTVDSPNFDPRAGAYRLRRARARAG